MASDSLVSYPPLDFSHLSCCRSRRVELRRRRSLKKRTRKHRPGSTCRTRRIKTTTKRKRWIQWPCRDTRSTNRTCTIPRQVRTAPPRPQKTRCCCCSFCNTFWSTISPLRPQLTFSDRRRGSGDVHSGQTPPAYLQPLAPPSPTKKKKKKKRGGHEELPPPQAHGWGARPPAPASTHASHPAPLQGNPPHDSCQDQKARSFSSRWK